MEYIITRLAEPTTWKGIAWLLTALGISISPDMEQAITIAGMAVVGVISVWQKEHKGKTIITDGPVTINTPAEITTTPKG